MKRLNFESGRCSARVHFRNFKTAQSLRKNPNCIKISNGSWHFSYIGNPERIIKKIESFSHSEYNTDQIKNKEKIIETIEEGGDILGRDTVYHVVEIDDSFPKPVVRNPERWQKLIRKN